jgi:hypothetical protein
MTNCRFDLFAIAGFVTVCHLLAQGSGPEHRSETVRVLPTPTGPFAVGRVTTHWVDETRIEPLSPNHTYREVLVNIWYRLIAPRARLRSILTCLCSCVLWARTDSAISFAQHPMRL